MGTLFALATLGAEGALLLEDGVEVARAVPPSVEAGAGLLRATPSPRASSSRCSRVARAAALERACAAGALAASRRGAQPSLPTAAEVDAILAA